jgi:hypothetical protein
MAVVGLAIASAKQRRIHLRLAFDDVTWTFSTMMIASSTTSL